MKFNVGDRVLFKNEILEGKIIRINSDYKVTVISLDGFEMNVQVKDLVKIEEGTDQITSYGTNFNSKEDTDKKLVNQRRKKKPHSVLKVDLHVELLISNFQSMDNAEIVQIQLRECYNAIEKALNSNITKLEIIHGIGHGILKDAVHAILRSYNLRFYLSRDGGATEVYL